MNFNFLLVYYGLLKLIRFSTVYLHVYTVKNIIKLNIRGQSNLI